MSRVFVCHMWFHTRASLTAAFKQTHWKQPQWSMYICIYVAFRLWQNRKKHTTKMSLEVWKPHRQTGMSLTEMLMKWPHLFVKYGGRLFPVWATSKICGRCYVSSYRSYVWLQINEARVVVLHDLLYVHTLVKLAELLNRDHRLVSLLLNRF